MTRLFVNASTQLFTVDALNNRSVLDALRNETYCANLLSPTLSPNVARFIDCPRNSRLSIASRGLNTVGLTEVFFLHRGSTSCVAVYRLSARFSTPHASRGLNAATEVCSLHHGSTSCVAVYRLFARFSTPHRIQGAEHCNRILLSSSQKHLLCRGLSHPGG